MRIHGEHGDLATTGTAEDLPVPDRHVGVLQLPPGGRGLRRGDGVSVTAGLRRTIRTLGLVAAGASVFAACASIAAVVSPTDGNPESDAASDDRGSPGVPGTTRCFRSSECEPGMTCVQALPFCTPEGSGQCVPIRSCDGATTLYCGCDEQTFSSACGQPQNEFRHEGPCNAEDASNGSGDASASDATTGGG